MGGDLRLAALEEELERRTSERLGLIEAELARRSAETRAKIMAELFDEQRALLLDESRYLAVCCSRRAGKTHTLSRMIAVALLDCGRNEWVAFCAKTLPIAKGLVWSELEELNRVHKLGWRMLKQTGEIETAAGGRFILAGISDGSAADKLRGNKYRLVICDEAATYQHYLDGLITPVIEPALADLRGRLVLSGTPGRVCAGFWFKAATGLLPKYKRHHWTLRNNPHMPDADAYLRGILSDNNWTEEEPVYRQEYLGEWVDDANALVYAFVRDRNAPKGFQLPEPFDPDTWLVTMGLDFGMDDACAWVVLGSPRDSRKIYVLAARKEWGMLPDQAAKVTAELIAKYIPDKLVGDASGKPYIEEWNRRHRKDDGIPRIRPADKTDKVGSIALMNGDFRGGNLILLPEAEAYAVEAQYLPWWDEQRRKEHPSFDNHACDAALYAWKAHRSYRATPPETPITDQEAIERKRIAAERAERMRRRRGEDSDGPEDCANVVQISRWIAAGQTSRPSGPQGTGSPRAGCSVALPAASLRAAA